MKKPVACFILSLLGALSVAQAQTTAPATSDRAFFYAQPTLVVAFPGDFETAVGGGVAFGVGFARNHSVEFEAINFESQYDGDYFKVKFTPLLASYKYRLPLNDKLTAYVGGVAGVTLEKANFYSWFYQYSASDTAFTAGGVVGLNYALNGTISLDLSSKILYLSETDITTAGSMGFIQLGAMFRF